MNNVTNRKMFRPRNARNKLNQMGGIMASSVPLMQTVQRFANGTQVNVRPGPSTISKFGQVMQPTGYGVSSSFPYNRTTAPQNNPNVQRVIANNLAAQRAIQSGQVQDMPATNLVKEQEDPGLLARLADTQLSRGIATVFGDDPVARANHFRGKFGMNPIGYVEPPVPKAREGIQTLTEDVPPEFGVKPTMTSMAEAEIATQGSDPLAPAQQPLSVMGRDDEDAFTNVDVGALSVLGDKDLAQSGRDDEDSFADDTEVSRAAPTDSFADDEDSFADQPKPKEKKGITEQVSPAAVDIVTKTAKISTTDVPKSKDIIKEIGSTIQKQLDAGQFDEAEEGIAKATGIEERAENESSSRREMVEKERELIAEFLGVDSNEYKKDRGLALAEAAFRFMQTGDIGEAGQVLTARNREINAAQRQQTQAINAMAYKAVTGREETKADRDFRAQQAKFNRNHDFKMLAQKDAGEQKRLLTDMSFRAALNDSNNMLKVKMKNADLDALDMRINSEMLMLNKRLENATEIANASNSSAELIAQASREAANARAMMSGMGDGIRLAMLENSQKETPLQGEELTNFLSSRSKEIAVDTNKFGPGTFGRVVTDNAAIMLQNDYADNYGDAVRMVIEGIKENPGLAEQYAEELKAYQPSAPTYTTPPSDAEIEALVEQGVTKIIVGGKEKIITAVPDGA